MPVVPVVKGNRWVVDRYGDRDRYMGLWKVVRSQGFMEGNRGLWRVPEGCVPECGLRY